VRNSLERLGVPSRDPDEVERLDVVSRPPQPVAGAE